MTMRVCTKCKTPKPVTEFYRHRAAKSGLHSWCKECVKQKSREPSSIERSTGIGIELLARAGIPVVTGMAAGMKHIDLAAWGCVPIEVKYSELRRQNSNMFTWRFTDRQREVSFDGLFMLIADSGDSWRVFIVPCDVDWIADSRHLPKHHSINVTIESHRGQARYWELLQPYENRFDLIEEARLKYSEDLRREAARRPFQDYPKRVMVKSEVTR